MQIKQFYNQGHSQFSYIISSGKEAVIIDPVRDIEHYLSYLKDKELTLKYIFETHIHADFVSGHLELADKTGATIVYGPQVRVAYPSYSARHNEGFNLEGCSIKVLHTPGHTMESVCYLLNNSIGQPIAIFTGDTLFVGDVGRPDLMSGNKNAVELSAYLYHSINDIIKSLPDELVVYPGHGAGSFCGKNPGKEKFTTIGEQKKRNYALKDISLEKFTNEITSGLSVPPEYFFKVMSINIMGCRPMKEVFRNNLNFLSPVNFKAETQRALIVDTRNELEFSKAFIKGSVNIGLDGSFATWAGILLDPDHPVLLVCDNGREKEAIGALAQIGIENVRGILQGGINAWKDIGEPVDSVENIDAEDFYFLFENEGYILVDLRSHQNFKEQHIKRSLSIPLDELPHRLNEFSSETKYLLVCKGGYHSMMAASILKRNGINQVVNISGGFDAVSAFQPQYVESV